MKYDIYLDNGCGIESALARIEVEIADDADLTFADIALAVDGNCILAEGDTIHIRGRE